MSQSNPIIEDAIVDKDPSEAAFDALFAEISSVPESELVPVTLDVLTAVTTVLGALPELRAMRGDIEAKWRDFDLVQFDKIEQYTLALNYAQSVYKTSSAPKTGIVQLVSELTVIRDRLFADATALSNYGLIDSERLKHCKTATGYRPIAGDVFALATVFKDHWAAVEGKTAVTLAHLGQAKNMALALLEAVGLREQAPITVGEAALVRQKAFTLFVRAYDEARRAVLYLRAKAGDADNVAPSLYALRGSRRRAAEAELDVTPTAPVAVGGTAGSPPRPAPSIKIDNPLGLPIDNPFAS